MVRLDINRKRSGVPVLSRKQIDDIGERLVQDFCPDAMIHPQALDVDLFAQDYLGMEQDYQYLSHCGVYLGMTVFNDTNRVVVFNPEKQQAEYISARAKTIIIDNTLLDEKQEHRYRFTMGHEAAGHGVLHEAYFGYDRNQLSMFDTVNEAAMIQCRTDSSKITTKDKRFWDDHDWMEWQANAMSSAFLMPKKMVETVAQEAKGKASRNNPGMAAYFMADAVSEIFNVSNEAALYRLKSLGLVDSGVQHQSAVYDFLGLFAEKTPEKCCISV